MTIAQRYRIARSKVYDAERELERLENFLMSKSHLRHEAREIGRMKRRLRSIWARLAQMARDRNKPDRA